jgi:Ran GTPase-activating protein 1
MGNSDSKERRRIETEQAINTIHSRIEEEDINFESKEPILALKESLERKEFSGEPSDSSRNGLEIGRVDPERVDSTTTWPHSVQGRLVARVGKRRLLGSGTIIGPQLVLTCAHNVYSRDTGIALDKKKISFYPGMNGLLVPFGVHKVIEAYYPEEYKDNENEDYALLVLDNRIGDYTGYFGIQQYNRESLSNIQAKIYGYPALKTGQREYDHYLWGMEGPFQLNEYDMIDHTIDTSGGQSGSAIYLEEDNKYHIIGVHVKTMNTSSQGVYLNEARIDRIKGWIKDYYKKYSLITEIDTSKLRNAYELLIALDKGRFNLGNLSVLKLIDIDLQPKQAVKLAQANLKSLLILDLSINLIGDEGATALSRAKFIHLTELSLWNNKIGDVGATALSKAKLIHLKDLNLSSNQIGDEGAAALSRSNFINLTNLLLWSNQIGDAGAIALSKSKFINLTTLNLSINQIGDLGVAGLYRANFPNLTQLYLSSNQIGDFGVTALSQASFINLTTLDLSINTIRDLGVAALSHANFINLTTLLLSGNQIGDQGALALSQGNFINLTTLDLSRNLIKDDGAILLSEATFINLKDLYLSTNQVGDAGTIALSRGNFINLSRLDLSNNQIGDSGVDALTQANFRDIKVLYLWSNQIGEEAITKLRNKYTQAIIN